MKPFEPQARRTRMLVEAVEDELLVYDTRRHRVHCLNPAAARLLEACDGRTPVAALARRLSARLGEPVSEDAVWLGLDRLAGAGLLDPDSARRLRGRLVTRRAALGRMAAAGLAVAAVTSIAAPRAAEAQSGATGATGPTGPTGPTGT